MNTIKNLQETKKLYNPLPNLAVVQLKLEDEKIKCCDKNKFYSKEILKE